MPLRLMAVLGIPRLQVSWKVFFWSTLSQQAVTRSMDAAEREVGEEDAAAVGAGYESMSGEEEEVTWEKLRDGILSLTPKLSAVPAFQHHQKQGPLAQPVHPSDFNVQVHDAQEASYLTAHA